MGSPRDDGRRAAARVAAAIIAGALFCLPLALSASSTSGDIRERAAARSAVFSAAVTEIAGLWNWQWVQDRMVYSPVFDLTVHVKVPGGGKNDVCLGGHSVAPVVSYGDAFLGKGSVPRLCVKPLQEGAVAVTAWGMDVRIPVFLKKRLEGELKRGEAVVDVTVSMRGGEVLVCKVKIRGDLTLCTLEASSNLLE